MDYFYLIQVFNNIIKDFLKLKLKYIYYFF